MELMRRLHSWRTWSALVLVVTFGACLSASQNAGGTKAPKSKTAKQTPAKTAKGQAETRESIGTATMSKDGTIILDLRAKAEDGTVGESRFVYPKTHKQYADILKHLGGLKPGQSKPVPPWPDKP